MSDSAERLAAALADRYRLERELGQGGIATTYLAIAVPDPGRTRYLLRPWIAPG